MPRRIFRVGRSTTGLGLFATHEIPKRTLIAYYRGRKITAAEADEAENNGSRYMYELNSKWVIDGSSRRNVARYANHSCRPNAESDVVKGKITIRAIKAIAPGDEITYDYGKQYWNAFIKPKGCLCPKCVERRRKERAEKRALAKAKRLREERKAIRERAAKQALRIVSNGGKSAVVPRPRMETTPMRAAAAGKKSAGHKRTARKSD